MDKTAFIQHVFDQNWLWSFSEHSKDQITDGTIIEQVLLFGDVPELKQLFSIFDKEAIKKTWIEKVLHQSRYHKLNTYLATFFFEIANPIEFVNNHIIEYPRLERFRLLTSTH